jgi:hypothetical protein
MAFTAWEGMKGGKAKIAEFHVSYHMYCITMRKHLDSISDWCGKDGVCFWDVVFIHHLWLIASV